MGGSGGAGGLCPDNNPETNPEAMASLVVGAIGEFGVNRVGESLRMGRLSGERLISLLLLLALLTRLVLMMSASPNTSSS